MSKKDKRCLFASSKNGVRILVAFVLGQCVQLVIHAVALNLWAHRQIPFCMAGGFVIFFAVLMGMRVAVKESKEEWGRAENWRP